MSPHEMLPREFALAELLGVSRSTLRVALKRLLREGLIYAVRGTGTFVSERGIEKGSRLSGFSEDMRSRGMVPTSRVIRAERLPTAAGEATLGIWPGDVYRIQRLRLADSVPMCLETVEVPARSFPGLLELDLTGSLYGLMRDVYGLDVVVADERVYAVVAHREEAVVLGIEVGGSLLEVARTGYDSRGLPIERALSRYRGDRYHFAVTATRNA